MRLFFFVFFSPRSRAQILVPAAMEPTDIQVDHAIPFQVEAPTDNSGGQSIVDTLSFDGSVDGK